MFEFSLMFMLMLFMQIFAFYFEFPFVKTATIYLLQVFEFFLDKRGAYVKVV